MHVENHADKVVIIPPLRILGQRGLNIINCIRKASLRPYMAEQMELDRMRELLLSPSVSSKATSSISSYSSRVVSLLITPLLRSKIV